MIENTFSRLLDGTQKEEETSGLGGQILDCVK